MRPRGEHVLANLNFTFGVLDEARETWLRTVKEGCDSAGFRCLVSAHPAERSESTSVEFANVPFRHTILGAGVLVSRFSTVPFEAIAHGRAFVYHNPHGGKSSRHSPNQTVLSR